MSWTIFRTQVWELWRVTRNDLFQRAMVVGFLTLLIYGGFQVFVEEGVANSVLDPVMSLVFGIILLGVVVPMSLPVANVSTLGIQGIIRSQFVQPISVAQMVIVPLFFGLVVSAVFGVGTLLFLRLVFGLGYDVLVTMAVALPLAITLQAFAIGTRDTVTFFVLIVALGLLYVLGVFTIPDSINFPLATPGEWALLMSLPAKGYLILYGVAFLAIPLTLWSVNRIRHEPEFSVDGASNMTLLRPGKAVRHRQPFSTPLRAQWWMEMHRVVGHTVGSVFSGLSIFLVFALGIKLGLVPPQHFNGAVLLVLAILQLSLLAGNVERVSGMSGARNARRISVFEATQGIGVAQSLCLKVSVVLLSSLVGSVLLTGAAVFSIAQYQSVTSTVNVQAISDWLLSMSVSPKAWLAGVGIVPTVVLTVVLLAFMLVYLRGRTSARVDRAITVASVTLIPAYGTLFLLGRVRDWDLSTFWAIHGWAIGVYIAIIALRDLRRVWQRELLGMSVLVPAIGVWVVFVTTVIWAVSIVRPDLTLSVAMSKMHLLVFFAGLLSIPLGSVAWAPLALDAQRSQ